MGDYHNGGVVELGEDYTRTAIEDVIKKELFTDYQTVIMNASAKGDNFLGLIRSVSVTGTKQDGEKGELNLILKLPIDSDATRERFPIGNLYNREVLGYNFILPKLAEFQSKFTIPKNEQFKYVKCYSADSRDMKEYLVFEDIRKSGFQMMDRKTPMDLAHLQLSLKTLANFHALSFGMKHENPSEFIEFAKDLENPMMLNRDMGYYLDIQRDRAIKVLDNPESIKRMTMYGVDLYDKMLYYMDCSTADPYNVLCHGDCWNNNFLFKYEDSNLVDIMLLDWQMLRYTSPITDIAYLVFTSTGQDVRSHFEEDVLDFYYDSLKARLRLMDIDVEDVYPETIYRDHAKKLLTFGLLMSLILVPAAVGEAEDVKTVEFLSEKETIDASDLAFTNELTINRYSSRMKGIIDDFVRLNLI